MLKMYRQFNQNRVVRVINDPLAGMVHGDSGTQEV